MVQTANLALRRLPASDAARAKTGTEADVSPWRFFALTYVLSWAIWTPLVLAHFDVGPFDIPDGSITLLRLLGVLMPAVASMVLVARLGGRRLLGSMLGRLKLWRFSPSWWAAAVLAQPVALVVCGLAYAALGGSMSPVVFGSAAEAVVTVIFLGIAVLGEEIGWRGVALPALQARMSPARASLVLGALWAVWHIPFWLLLDTYTQFGLAYLALNLLLIVPTTIYISWFFNHMAGSLLVVAGFHLIFNIVNTAWLPVTTYIPPFVAFIAVQWVLAAAVLPRLGAPARLSRA